MSSRKRPLFKKIGNISQLVIRDAEDLQFVTEMEDAYFVASGAPLDAIAMPTDFLRFIDADHNERIMCHEVKEAVRWLLSVLKDKSLISRRSDSIAAEELNIESADGLRMQKACNKIINLQKLSGRLQLDILNATIEELAGKPNSGILLPDSAHDEQLQNLIPLIIEVTGGAAHPSGKRGIDEKNLRDFSEKAQAYRAWMEEGRMSGEGNRMFSSLGSSMPRIFELFTILSNCIDIYFYQCQAAAMDERFIRGIFPSDEEIKQTDLSVAGNLENLVRKMPLAQPRTDAVLDSNDSLNPYYRDELLEFFHLCVKPLYAGDVLHFEQWEEIKRQISGYAEWNSRKPDSRFERLPKDQFKLCIDDDLIKKCHSLIQKNMDASLNLENLILLKKLLLFQKYILDFLNNFVSFPKLYNPRKRAAFEMGTLVLDGRHFTLSVLVNDRSRHKALSQTAGMFVMYVHVLEVDGTLRFELAVPVTAGGKGNLFPGKHGIFHDLSGREHDAVVSEIIVNPISFYEALWSPFRRLGAMIGKKIDSVTAEAERKLEGSADEAFNVVTNGTGQTAAAAKSQTGTVGIIAGGGVALAALSSAIAYITSTLASISWWKILAGFGTAILALIVPITVSALIKLRRRDLSSILEGSGWAINARMRLTGRIAGVFTHRPDRFP